MICDMSYCQDRLMVAGDEDLRRPRERGARFIPARWSESDAPPLYDPSRLRRGDGAFLDRRPAPPRNVTREDLICVVPRGSFSSRFSGGNRSKRECECWEGPTHIPTGYFYSSLRILLSATPSPRPRSLACPPASECGRETGRDGPSKKSTPRAKQPENQGPKARERRRYSTVTTQPDAKSPGSRLVPVPKRFVATKFPRRFFERKSNLCYSSSSTKVFRLQFTLTGPKRHLLRHPKGSSSLPTGHFLFLQSWACT